ncbi:hypothetical protein BH09MYX1_BH09MYX1_39470 [soil metagenome]
MRLAPALTLFLLFGCGTPAVDLNVKPFDAGLDGDAKGESSVDDPSLGGPCEEDVQCDDKLACTFEKCDLVIKRCRITTDDSLCDDGMFCNGKEVCVPKLGCRPGPVVGCSTGNACDINKCIESTKACEHKPRDADGDGDPDDLCAPKHDCNDQNPLVASTLSEICGNGIDDDCDGQKDEQPCSVAQNATCQTALAIAGPGSYSLSTAAAPKGYTASCSVAQPSAAHDVVAAVTIPSGGPKDLDVWLSAPGGSEVAVAIQGTCGSALSELSCTAGYLSSSAHARARGLAPGTYYVIATAAKEATLELSVDLLTPTPKAPNESCGNATPIADGVAFSAQIFDAAKDLASACTSATGELTYSFTLASPRDVRVFANATRGVCAPVLGLSGAGGALVADELRCRQGAGTQPLYARALAAGTYYVTVAATSSIDAQVLFTTYAPTVAPADQTCATAPPATINGTTTFDLVDHEDAIKDGCFPGSPTAAYAVDLSVASDVLLVGRYAQNGLGAVSFDAPGCTAPDRLLCAASYTPVRTSKRNVPPGSYRAIVADSYGLAGSLSTFVRPTVQATAVVDADTCASQVVDIPADGGFFTGDTTGKASDFDESCDVPNVPPGGAADQIFRLVVTQPRRVVISMDGSTYDTLLSLRSGSACPGIELKNGCNFSFSGARSFIDTVVGPGTYWVIVDGFGNQKGAWNLDVRVVVP